MEVVVTPFEATQISILIDPCACAMKDTNRWLARFELAPNRRSEQYTGTMPRGRKSICTSALQEFVEGVDTFSAATGDLLDLPSPPMRKSKNRRRSISTTPIKSKFRDVFMVSASLACLRSVAEFEATDLFALPRPPVPVRAEFSPLEEEIVVVDITQASPLREVTNLTGSPRGPHGNAKQQQQQQQQQKRQSSWTFALLDIVQAVTKVAEDEYHLQIHCDDGAFVLVCPRHKELTSYLVDCELIQKGGAEDPTENIVAQEQLDRFFSDIDCTSQAQTPTKDESGLEDDSFLREDAADCDEASADKALRTMIREFVQGTRLWDAKSMLRNSYDSVYFPFQDEHTKIFELYDYPIISRLRLDDMQVNPTTRDGKMAILQRIGVEKLISQNSQRAQQDLDLEKKLGVQAKRKAWGFDYMDLQSRHKLAFEEWSMRYMTHIGKECGLIEVSEWDQQSRCYRCRARLAADNENDETAATPELESQAVNQDIVASEEKMMRQASKVLVRVAREQRRSPSSRSSPVVAVSTMPSTPPPPHIPTSPMMASSGGKNALTINTVCPTPPPPSITNSPSRDQQDEKRSPTGFRQRLEFSIQSADEHTSTEPASPMKQPNKVATYELATPVQKPPQTPKSPSSPAPSPPNQLKAEQAPKNPSPRERRLVSSSMEQPLAQPTFTVSPIADRRMSEARETQPTKRAALPSKIPAAAAGVPQGARNAIEQRLWNRWELALRQYNWELVTEEAIQRALQLRERQ